MYSDLISALDSEADSHAMFAFLDMTAAFETVDHGILLQRLQRSYGITEEHWLGLLRICLADFS